MSDEIWGNYEGKGSWYEVNGDSGEYSVTQSMAATPEGLAVVFEHAHADGTTSKLAFTLKPVAHTIYRVYVADRAVGYGFHIDNVLRFHFNNQHLKPGLDSVTELSFQLKSANTVDGFGSATVNSAGNYIMWREELSRT